MRSFSNKRVIKALLLAGGASAFVTAIPAMAQEAGATEDDRIVVTGSRIQRQDYESTSPIVTVDETILRESATAAIEQNLNRLPQFTPAKTPTGGGDIQPTATNTPGAATISLRGLGANRNLVLIDGRRATPSNAAGVVDINTIPSAAIETVEIMTGGASSTYGADAVAGVTNFRLRRNFQGLELDGQAGITQEGDGFEYQLSGIMGTDFDDGRGNISIAMSTNVREANYQRDRSWYQDLWANPNIATNRFFPLYPGISLGFGNAVNNSFINNYFGSQTPTDTITLKPGTDPTQGFNYNCTNNGNSLANPIFSGLCSVVVTPGGPINVLGGNQGYGIYANPDGSLFTTGFNQRGGTKGFDGQVFQNDLAYRRANGALNFVDTTPYLILPLTRYNMFMRGNYELNDWIGVFAQGLYSTTHTSTTQQGGSITGGWDVFFPYGSGVYTGSANPSTAYGTVGIPSSVILNGMTFGGASYVDNTPGDLTDNPTNPAFRATYGDNFSCALNATGGCTNNQLFGQFLPADVQALLNARANPNGRVELLYGFPENRTVSNRVNTLNLLAGFEGTIPGSDINFEVFVNHGATETFTRQTGVFSLTRLRTLLMSPGFGLDFNTNSNTASGRPAFGANFASCRNGMNLFKLTWDQVGDDCKQAIAADLKNNQRISQTIAEANFTGDLFDLPAGPLGFAAGVSYREQNYEFINDTLTGQGQSFLDQAVGIYPSSDTFGALDVHEFYGELLIPVLEGLPLVESFSLELGGRSSKYSTTGTSYTYKILGDWEVTDWLRLRGGFNRAERSPNIAELFQASSQIFGFSALGDLCSTRSSYRISANPAAGGNSAAAAADVQAVCRAVMDRTGGAGTGAAYYGRDPAQQPAPGGGFAWTNARGNPNLTPEKVNTWTAGMVVNSPFTSEMLSNLRFTADWYSIKVTDAIGLQGAGTALQQCLDPFYNPSVAGAGTNAANAAAAAANQFCSGIRYDPAPVLGAANFDVTYYNNGEVSISGIDSQLDWRAPVGPGSLNLNVLVNYYLHYKSRELASNPLVDYVGTLGTAQNGLNAGAYKYRVLTTIGYNLGAASISLQWQHLPSIEQEGAAVAPTVFTGYPAYDLFNLRTSYQISDAVRMRFGVDNLLNKAPPIGNVNTTANPAVGTLGGGAFNSNFYDTNGRRFYLGATLTF